MRFATFRDMLETSSARKIIGFDAFGAFPRQDDAEDNQFIESFESAGGDGLDLEEMEAVIDAKGFSNIELIKGDITKTLPLYKQQKPELRIALVHIDVDVYLPSKVILEELYDLIVPGSIIVLDDYGLVSGETRAVDEFFKDKSTTIEKLPFSHVPAFIRK